MPAQTLTAESPGKILTVRFELDGGKPAYQVSRFGRTIIDRSHMGFSFREGASLDRNLEVLSSEVRSIDETWEQVWGEQRLIENRCGELIIRLRERSASHRQMAIIFRVFDDGLGFRYEFPSQPGLRKFAIIDELTEFRFAGNHRAWWIGAYQWNRYEYLYQSTSLDEIDTVHTPLTLETANGLYLSIHEAALTDFASMTLARTGAQLLKADLVPWSDGTKVYGSSPMKTPWRTILITDTPGELITSNLVLNLNEPNKLQDVSWIKPGKYVGIWWEMHLGIATWGSGDQHGATTANALHYIDFAAAHGFDGVLVEGWNRGWDGDWIQNGDKFDFTTPYPDFDIDRVCQYAAGKNVRLIGHHETAGGIMNYERQMEDAFAFYEKLGVRAVKTGYVNHGRNIKRMDEDGSVQLEWHHGQHMVRHYRKVVELAAQYQIMLDVHEPIKDTGIRRTYPNMMTREGARGQEFNAWSGDGGNPPDHTTLLPFTRLLGGPMDFTPGIFDLLFEEVRPENRVNTTLAKQLALYIIIFSPLHMAADLPENYEANPRSFQFIKDVVTDWEETRVLHARIGDFITVARKARGGEDWYVGSITDEEGRMLRGSLSFLNPGQTYVAEIYRDGPAADWERNPYDIEIIERLVNSNGILELRLAPGGGQAIRFRPASGGDLERLKSGG